MTKITLSELGSLTNEQSALTVINNNKNRVVTAFENTLSRDGTLPNQMEANLDMNSNRIINLPYAVGDDEPVTLGQFETGVAESGAAPSTSQYVTLASSSGLSAERVLTAGTNVTLTDAGANSTITVSAPYAVIGPSTTVSGQLATWNNTTGTLLADLAQSDGPGSIISGGTSRTAYFSGAAGFSNWIWNGNFAQWSARVLPSQSTVEVCTAGSGAGFATNAIADGWYAGPGNGATFCFSQPFYDTALGTHYGQFRWTVAATTPNSSDYPNNTLRGDFLEWISMANIELANPGSVPVVVEWDAKSSVNMKICPEVYFSMGNSVWAASTAVSVGDIRIASSGRLYIVTTAGTTASSGGPTGTGTGITDGTAVWSYRGEARGNEYELFQSSGSTTVSVALGACPSGSDVTSSWQSFRQVIYTNALTAVDTTNYSTTANATRYLTPPTNNSYLGLAFSYDSPSGGFPMTPTISMKNIRAYPASRAVPFQYPNLISQLIPSGTRLGTMPAYTVKCNATSSTALPLNCSSMEGVSVGQTVPANGSFTTLAVAAILTLSPNIDPTISASQDDWAPTNFGTTTHIRVDGGAADRNITGIAGGVSGRVIIIANRGTSNNIVFVNASASSSAANRFAMAGDISLYPGNVITFRYDGTSSVWRPINSVLDAIIAGSHTYVGAAQFNSTATVFDNTLFSIKNSSDATKIIAFSAASITTGTTRTLTCPDASGIIALTAGATIPTIAQGDLLYGSAANTLTTLTKSTGTSNFLKNSGTSNNPAWAQPAASDLSNGTTGSGSVVLATAPTVVGGSFTALTALAVRSTGAAFDITLASDDGTLTTGRTLNIRTQNGNRLFQMSGDLTLGGSFTTSGASALTLTTSGATNVTLPTTGTLATLAGVEELTNKTLTTSVGKGTWTASGTWTLPAFTLGGTVSGGGNQLNNTIIGTTTPLAGTFTTLTGTAGSITGLTAFALRDTSAAFDVTIAATSTSALTVGRTLTLDMGNAANTLKFTAASTITFPSGTKTLVDTTVTTLSSLVSIGTVTTGTWNATVVAGLYGGTGLSTAAVGDIIYASATTPTWARLADVATGSVLTSGGVNTAPAWSAAPTLTTSLKVPVVGPTSDSTTAFKITKTDLSTAVVTVDTTNARVGINRTPGAYDLDVNGAMNIQSTSGIYMAGAQMIFQSGSYSQINAPSGTGASITFGNATDSSMYITAALNVHFRDGSSVDYLTISPTVATIKGAVTVSSTTASTSKTTGSGIFGGGIGVAGATFTDTLSVITMANAATTSAVCYNTGTGLLTYDATVGTCTVSLLEAKNPIAQLTSEDGLRIVMGMQPWRYTLKENLPTYVAGEQIGFIAEYAQEVDPRIVARNHDGTLAGMRYEQFTAVLTASIHALKQEIDQLKRKLNDH